MKKNTLCPQCNNDMHVNLNKYFFTRFNVEWSAKCKKCGFKSRGEMGHWSSLIKNLIMLPPLFIWLFTQGSLEKLLLFENVYSSIIFIVVYAGYLIMLYHFINPLLFLSFIRKKWRLESKNK